MQNSFLYKAYSSGDGCFDLELIGDCPVFKGHFPGFPVLPGAAVIEIVREIVSGMAGREIRFVRMRSVKFMRMIVPWDRPRVSAVLDENCSSLRASVSVNGTECVKISAVCETFQNQESK